MTPEQRAQLAKAIEGANKLRAEICERYGGPFYPSSGEVISEMRDERSHALE